MLRFVLPAFALTAAFIFLFAGALGDLRSWPNLSDKVRTIIGDVAPSPAPLPPARTAAPPAAPAAAVAEPQAARDPLRGQTADRQASEPAQQNVRRSNGVEQISRAPDAARQKPEQQMATAAPTGAASAELQARRDALQRQVADLQRQSGDMQQQVAQRSNDLAQSSHELDAARSDTTRLRQDIEALEQLRKTAEQQMTAAARSTPTTPGPSAAAAPEQQPPQDELRRQNADLQQQAALRSRDLDAARAETSKLRQDIDALNQLHKTQEEQTAAAASARPPARGPSNAALAEQQAAGDVLRRQIADLQQQVAQRSHDLDAAKAEAGKLRQDNDALNQLRKTQEQQIAAAASARPPAGPSAAASAEQQAAQDVLRRQIADLQQQVAQRSQDLDAAKAETGKLRRDNDALNQLRKTQEEQIAAAGPSAAAIAAQQAAQDAAIAEQLAAQDALRAQIEDLQQQVAQRSQDLETANAETGKLRQANDALNRLRETQEKQIAAAAAGRPPPPGPSAAAIAEQQAAQDALRRQNADLQQQVAQRSHDLDAAHAETSKLRQDIDALNKLRKTQEQQIAAAAARPPAPGPSAAAIAEQQAAQDTLRRQNADLQQQVAQRSHDLDAAHAETSKLRQDIDALNQLRKTQEQQIAAAAAAGRPPAPGPSAAAIAEQQAAQDALRRQNADLQQQAAQRSHDLDAAHAETSKLRQDIDALNQLRKTQEQQFAAAAAARPAPSPSAAAIAEQQAAQDALLRQVADLQQQAAQRSQDLEAAHAETGKLRQNIEALSQLRKTQEQQFAAAAAARPAPGPSAAAIAEQQAAQDILRRQNADLQQQVAQRSHDLDAAHAETGKLRQDIDTLNQLRKTQEQQLAAAASARPPPPRPFAASAEQQEAQRRQIADLQQQVAQRSHDLDSARADTVTLREGLDASRQQRKLEEASAARQKAQEQQMAAAATRPAAPRQTPAPAQPTPQRVLQTPLAAPTAQPTSAPTAAPPVAPPAEAQPPASPQLLTARQWLASGRPDEARRVLAMVQTRMVLRPVTPDRPAAEGGNPSATDVGNAIRWLDMGANGQAMQAIDRAIGNANAPVSTQPWSGYPPGYTQQGFATSGSSR